MTETREKSSMANVWRCLVKSQQLYGKGMALSCRLPAIIWQTYGLCLVDCQQSYGKGMAFSKKTRVRNPPPLAGDSLMLFQFTTTRIKVFPNIGQSTNS